MCASPLSIQDDISVILLSILILLYFQFLPGVHPGRCWNSGRHRADHCGDPLPQAQHEAGQAHRDGQGGLHSVERNDRGE